MVRSLVDNAIKYTPEGGQIAVSARQVDHVVAITVADSGKGIAKADIPHVFEKFYRASSENSEADSGSASGVGLGLYLAHHVVTQLDGEIVVESEPGIGSTFKVLLPLWSENGITGEEIEEVADDKTIVGG